MRTLVGTARGRRRSRRTWPCCPPTLEDLDSVNFALGVRHFDVAQHQPHPPGYPVFIALGKVGTSALARAGVATPGRARPGNLERARPPALLPLLFFVFFRG